MVDIHTHILPCMDDGSSNLEQSILMLKEMVNQGVDTVVLTPHYDARRESPVEFIQRRNIAADNLQRALGNTNVSVKLMLGAEVAYFEGMSHVEDLDALCIDGTRCMLLEMPFCVWGQRILSEIEVLQQVRGVRLILAHIERYRAFLPNSVFTELSENGVWLQCNTSFFVRWRTYLPAMTMLKRHLVHFIASDCHNLESRPPNLGETMERIRRKSRSETIEFLLRNEQMLLGG